jgi:hypothetical protein
MRKVSIHAAIALLGLATIAACGPTSPDTAAPAQGSVRLAASGVPAEVLEADETTDVAAADDAVLLEETARAYRAACAIDKRSLQTASEAYVAQFGTVPTEADLVANGLLSTESQSQDLLSDGSVVAAGICIGIEEASEADLNAPEVFGESDRNRCEIDLRIIQVAVASFGADFGAVPPNEAALVPTYLGAESETYDIALDGSAFVAPGGPCA